jgi:hypothetical protein
LNPMRGSRFYAKSFQDNCLAVQCITLGNAKAKI